MAEIDDEINNEIIVDAINILMSTNIPGQAELSLTSKTIVGSSANAAKYNEYPYITRSIKIKEGYLRNKSFNDILDYFFIKDLFVKKTNEMRANIIKDKKPAEETRAKPKTDEEEEKEEADEDAKELEATELKKIGGGNDMPDVKEEELKQITSNSSNELDNLKSNIQLLLRMVFDTYPINGNVASSLDRTYTTKLYNLNKYSYLNINGKPYTVSKIIWVNDIYNHYTSKQLIKDYKEFNAWKIGEQGNIKRSKTDIERTRTSLIASTRGSKMPLRVNLKDDISKIKSYMLNPSNWTNKTQSLITIRNALEIFYAHLIPILFRTRDRKDYHIKELSDEKEKLTNEKEKLTNEGQTEEVKDQQHRIDNIISILKRSKKEYTVDKTTDYVTELNRTANVVINSNILPITSGVKNLIKDLNENNEKRITLENNANLIDLPTAIFGNDKYKDTNYKTLTDAISKDIKTLKKNVNMQNNSEFTPNSIRTLVKKLLIPSKPEPANDETGIIYDNNNVTTPKYEIYTYVDLIDGKITDDNKNSLDLCTFRDELLLIKFNQLISDDTHTLQHDPLIKLLKPKPKDESKLKLQGGGNTKKNKLFCNRTKKYV